MSYLVGFVFIAMLCTLSAAVPSSVDGTETKTLNAFNCYDYQCNQSCMSAGYNRGRCIKDTCICSESRKLSEETRVKKSADQEPTCKDEDCDAECRSIGCARGLCAGEDCYCDIWKSKSNFSQSKLRDIKSRIKKSVDQEPTCKDEDCDAECRSIGCARGLCAGEDCYCDIWKSKSNFSQSKLRDIKSRIKKSVDQEPTCKDEDCDAECRSIGCARGLCAGDDCYCDIWKSKSNFSQSKLRDIKSRIKKSVDQEPTCKDEDCDAECRSIGCARGLCAGDDCYCDIWKSKSNFSQSKLRDIIGNKVSTSSKKL